MDQNDEPPALPRHFTPGRIRIVGQVNAESGVVTPGPDFPRPQRTEGDHGIEES